MRRLPLAPVDVQRVARAAPCCTASVVRWLHGVDGNAGTDKLIRAALLELDLHPTRLDPLARVDRETRQLVMPAVDTPMDNPPASPRGDGGNGGQIYSATPPSSTGESAGAITGTVEYACPGGRDAASPVSTKSKDPVSAPARAAAGGIESAGAGHQLGRERFPGEHVTGESTPFPGHFAAPC